MKMAVFGQSILLLVLWSMAWPLGTLAGETSLTSEIGATQRKVQMKMVVFRQSILLLVLGLMAWPLGTLADKFGTFTETRGRQSLLGNITDIKPDSQPHLQWGKGIRLMLHSRNKCSSLWEIQSLNYMLIFEISRFIGPVYCVETVSKLTIEMKEFWQQNSFDIYAPPLFPGDKDVSYKGPKRTFLYPHLRDNLCLVIKKIDPQRQSIINTFTYSSWAATCVGVAMFLGALRLADRQYLPLEALRTFLFGSFFESRRPIPNFLSVAFSIFGLIIITAFSSKLMTFLAFMKEAPQPQTLAEAETRVTRMYFTWQGYASFRNTDVVRKLLKKTVPYTEWTDVLEDVVTSVESAYLATEALQDALVHDPWYITNTTGNVLTHSLHMVPECVLSPAYPAYYVAPGWPHRERFSALQQRAVEAGIPIKRFSDLKFYRVYTGGRIRDIPPSDDPEPFTLKNVSEALVVLELEWRYRLRFSWWSCP